MRFVKYFVCAMAFSIFAQAGEVINFSQEKYEAAIKDGKSIVLDFHASWCPTCRKQEPILKEIVLEKPYEKFIFFKANYDSEKNLKKQLSISRQSTIVVFKAGKEVAREVGLTDKKELKALIDKAM